MYSKLLLLIFMCAMAMQTRSQLFSDQVVTIGDDNFMPYTRGEIEKQFEGDRKVMMEKIFEIITSWDSIHPPRGFKVDFYGSSHSLDISFSTYVNEENTKFVKGGPSFSIFINDPFLICGSPEVNDIFLLPVKVADFYGFPIYQNTRQEITVISKINEPLFVPVSCQEYLKELIIAEENKQNTTGNQTVNSIEDILSEMEKSYKELLKINTAEAAVFKISMDEFRAEQKNADAGYKPVDMLQMLKRELEDMPLSQRNSPAYYSIGAIEQYGNISGLVPAEQATKEMALVRIAPAFNQWKENTSAIKLLVIHWNLGNDNSIQDKPRYYHGGSTGFMLADNKMAQLYNQQNIWESIFKLLK